MVGVANNRRTQYTVNVLKETLLSLLTQKELSKITVTEICDMADVNRGTFYLHYDNPIDLFNQIEEEIMDEILPLLDDKPHDHFRDWMTRLIEVIDDHRQAMKIIIKDDRPDSPVFKLFEQAHEKMVADMMECNPDFDRVKDEYRFRFCLDGAVGMITKWLEDEDISSDEVAELMMELMDKNVTS